MNRRAQHAMTNAGLLTLLLALALVATWPIWREVFKVGVRDPEQSHILLALPVAAWLAWVRRARLRLCRLDSSLWGCAIIVLGGVTSIVGLKYDFEIGWHFGALLIILGVVATVYGVDLLYRFLPVCGALLALLPVPGRVRQEIALPLQQISAQAGEFILDLFGVAISRSGNVLVINEVQVAVAEACNGMRMVAALGLVTYAFVFGMPMRNSVRFVIVLSGPLIAILVNIVRLVPTALCYGYCSKETADLFHDLSGWGVLALAVGFLWSMLAILRWLEFPISPYGVAEEHA